MQQEYFTENKAIINEGELGTCMYVLADGQLEVRKGGGFFDRTDQIERQECQLQSTPNDSIVKTVITISQVKLKITNHKYLFKYIENIPLSR